MAPRKTDSDKMEIISRNIQRLLADRGDSQADLARHLGISESSVGKWILMHNAPSMGNVQRMAEYFDVQVSDLLEDKPEPAFIDPERRYLLDQLHTMTDDQVKQLSALWDIIDKQTRDQ